MTGHATVTVASPSSRGGEALPDARTDPASEQVRRQPRRGMRSPALFGLVFAGYLAVAVVLWWHAWSTHPTTVTTCGCGDPSLSLWFLEWPAYALAHGHNLFYSTALFHPGGINLLANTSVLAIGIPLAPVTWLFGPVATLNVASTLGPALSALSMFWLLRRWVAWTPAAFIGGLVFGFSPFVFVNLAGAHLMTGILVLLPLMVACLDELLVRQRRRPLLTGAFLGILVTVQFFLSTEVLALVVLCAVAALVLLIVYALRHPGHLAARAPHAGRGLLAALAVAAVFLAYPVWFALEGPAHLSGLVWPTIEPGHGGITLGNLWHLTRADPAVVRLLAGYQGPALPDAEYLGAGMFAVLVAGVVAWRRDRRLGVFGALGLIAIVLSLGSQRYWTPWRLLVDVPLIQNVLPGRIMSIVTLCGTAMLAIVVDRAYGSVTAWVLDRRTGGGGRHAAARAGDRGRPAGGGAAPAVAAVAVVPLTTVEATNVPITTRAVTLPRWFADAAPHLPPGQVMLAFPPPAGGSTTTAWQAVDRLSFALVTGTGRAGQTVIDAGSSVLSSPPPLTARNVDDVRQALSDWGVTLIAVADPTTLQPPYDRSDNTAWALGLVTVALARKPEFRGDTWVWTNVRAPFARLSISSDAISHCTAAYTSTLPQAVPDCVMAAAQPAGGSGHSRSHR